MKNTSSERFLISIILLISVIFIDGIFFTGSYEIELHENYLIPEIAKFQKYILDHLYLKILFILTPSLLLLVCIGTYFYDILNNKQEKYRLWAFMIALLLIFLSCPVIGKIVTRFSQDGYISKIIFSMALGAFVVLIYEANQFVYKKEFKPRCFLASRDIKFFLRFVCILTSTIILYFGIKELVNCLLLDITNYKLLSVYNLFGGFITSELISLFTKQKAKSCPNVPT